MSRKCRENHHGKKNAFSQGGRNQGNLNPHLGKHPVIPRTKRESYATQIDYYTKLAKKKKSEWNMVEIFADEHAIIGTSGENLVKSRVSALVPFNFFVKGKYNFI